MRIVTLGVALVLLSGCAATPPVEPTPPISTSVETIPRDGVEELAITAVTNYFRTSAVVAADGGADPDRIAHVVTARWLPNEIAGFATLGELGTRQVGAPTITKIEATSIRGIAAVSEVVVHVCTALDGVAVVSDDFGEDLTPDGTTLVSVFVVPEDGVMKVDGVQPWADSTWCLAP
ncbi:MAG: hypothetical protein ACKOWN_00445 [Microbacteriaceae bacterium]